jgi:hypothetical protein
LRAAGITLDTTATYDHQRVTALNAVEAQHSAPPSLTAITDKGN